MTTMPEDRITVVICLDHAALKGGQERVAFDSAIGLNRRGHRPIVFAAAGPVASDLIDAGIETICIDQTNLAQNPSRAAAAIRGLWNKQAAEALGRLLSDLPRKNTIIHVHGWASALSPSIASPIRTSGHPAIFTIHDYYQFCPNGGFYNYKDHHICGLEPLSAACWGSNCDSRSYPRKLWRNARLLTAKHLSGLPNVFDDYIVLSLFQQTIVEDRVPANARLHRIPNPVSVPDLGRKAQCASGNILFVGRLYPEKGVLDLAEAARRANVTVTYIGEGPLAGELAASYPEACQLGWKNKHEVLEAMRAARALVFPSVWYEGQPLTVLEAQALGTPVIVSDACAGRESIEHGVSGLWFKSGNIDDLAQALTVMSEDATIEAMSDAAYARYWANPPTLETHIDNLMRVYRGAIGRSVALRARTVFPSKERALEPVAACHRQA